MANYANLPSMQLELLDGNLQAVQQLEGPIVLIIDTAKKGPNASQYVVTDPNKAVQVFGADSPIIESLSKVRFGGAKNVILYRVGGESASIKNLVTSGSIIETTDKSILEGANYTVYLGEPALASRTGVAGLVNQNHRYLIVKDDKKRIVYSNVLGAEINDGRFTISGFDPEVINALDQVSAIRIGRKDKPAQLEQVIAKPKRDDLGVVMTELDFFGNTRTVYEHPGSLYLTDEVELSIPAPKGAGREQIVSIEVSRHATLTNSGKIQIMIGDEDAGEIAFAGTETESRMASQISQKIAAFREGLLFSAVASGDEVTVVAREPRKNIPIVITKVPTKVGAKEQVRLVAAGLPTSAGNVVVNFTEPLTGVKTAFTVAIDPVVENSAVKIYDKIVAAIKPLPIYIEQVTKSTGANAGVEIVYKEPLAIASSRRVSVNTQDVKGLRIPVDQYVTGVTPVTATNATFSVTDVVVGSETTGAAELSDLLAIIPGMDVTAQIKARPIHPLVSTNDWFYHKGEYQPTRVQFIFTGAIDGVTYDQEIVDKTLQQIRDIRVARQEWVYDLPTETNYVKERPVFSASAGQVGLTKVPAEDFDFTSTKWHLHLRPHLFIQMNRREANGHITEDIMNNKFDLLNADKGNYRLLLEYDFLVDQAAAIEQFDQVYHSSTGRGGSASRVMVPTGDKGRPATYKAGADNIGASWEKMYEVIDSALDDLETTQATSVYLGTVPFDAPNITSLNKDRWTTVKSTDNIMRFVRKVQNSDGSISYRWSVHPTVWRHLRGGATGTLTDANRDASGNPVVYEQYHEANFAHRLAMFCHSIVEDEGFVLGTIGTTAPKSASTYDVTKWVGVAPTRDAYGQIIANGTGLLGNKYMSGQVEEVSTLGTVLKDARPKGFFYTDTGYANGQVLTDSNGAPVDIGKYLSIVPALVNMPNFSGFGQNSRTTSGAAIYSAVLQNVVAGDSTTNRLIPGVTLPFVIKKNKLDDLSNAGYVTFISKPSGVTVTSGEIPTWDGSDYQYVSTTIIVGDIARRLRARINPFLGKGLNDVTLAAMSTAVEQVFADSVESGAIRKFEYDIIQMPTVRGVGRVAIPSTIVPVFELRKVDSSIKLAYDI